MRTHRFETGSFVAGLVFLAAGIAFLTGDMDIWRLDWSWVWPAVLTVAGVTVLMSVRRDRSSDELPQDEADTQVPHGDDRATAPR